MCPPAGKCEFHLNNMSCDRNTGNTAHIMYTIHDAKHLEMSYISTAKNRGMVGLIYTSASVLCSS